MWESLRRWLLAIPYSEPLERRQALLIQLIELGKLIIALALLALPLMVPLSPVGRAALVGLTMVTAVAAVPALGLVRRGRLDAGALISALSLTVVLSVMLYGNTLDDGAVTMFAYAVPLTLAGVVAGRRALLIVLALSVLGVCAAVVLGRVGAPGAGFALVVGDTTAVALVSFVIVALLLAFVIDGLSALTREALAARRARERELEAMSRRLESAVRERTADLEIALGALEQRAAEQASLLDENQRQRVLISALSVPVLPLGRRTVVLPLVGEMDDARLAMVSEQALGAVERLAARRLLLDITGVPVVDTHVAQSLMRTVSAARLLGAEVALVGVRPEVAQAIVGLGIDLGPMSAFADLQSALG
ncbi:MAG: STAS domain-containing protein [Chloroflexales bacterium]|nr:STAS domain-containing protein [Chloroflexales bacterium]